MAAALAEFLMGRAGLLEAETILSEATPLLGRTVATEAAPYVEAEAFGTGAQARLTASHINELMAESEATGAALKRGAATTAAAFSAGKLLASNVPKIGGKRKAGSQSGAQPPYKPIKRRKGGPLPMPPKGVKSTTHWYDRTKKKWVKRKRPLKKRPSMRKKAYKKRTTRTKRTYKKKKTLKRKYMRMSGSRKYETHGVISRHRVSYFGFQAHGGRDELVHQVADAILRTICRKYSLKVLHTEAKISLGNVMQRAAQSLRFVYRRRKFPVAIDFDALNGPNHYGDGVAGDYHNLTDRTFIDTAFAIGKELKLKAQEGYMPASLETYEATTGQADSNRLHTDYKVGDMIIAVVSKSKIKLRNITRNDDSNGHDMTSVMKNPLEGYAYEFKGDVPLPKHALLRAEDGDAQQALSRFLKRDNVRGVCLAAQKAAYHTDGVQYRYATDDAPADANMADNRDDGAAAATNTNDAIGVFAVNRYMSVPPTGSTVFNNCRKTHKVVMPVGREMVHRIGFKYQGTLVNFLEKFNADTYREAPIGTCFWLGLKQKFNNSVRIDGTTGGEDINHIDVSVEYDIDGVISAAAQFVRSERTPAGVNSIELNSIFSSN